MTLYQGTLWVGNCFGFNTHGDNMWELTMPLYQVVHLQEPRELDDFIAKPHGITFNTRLIDSAP
jgi:hypothetical protein